MTATFDPMAEVLALQEGVPPLDHPQRSAHPGSHLDWSDVDCAVDDDSTAASGVIYYGETVEIIVYPDLRIEQFDEDGNLVVTTGGYVVHDAFGIAKGEFRSLAAACRCAEFLRCLDEGRG